MDYFWIIIVIGVLILWFIGSCITSSSRQSAANSLKEDGYEHIFSGGGNEFIAFNIQKGTFKFGDLLTDSFVERPISFLTNYEWKWIEKDGVKNSNKFLFYISDVNHFMHEVFYTDEERQAEVEFAKLQAVHKECLSAQYVETESMERVDSYDFFISHASENKVDIVRPLVTALENLGLKIWYDEFSLEIGDSLRRTIDQGLGNSRYGIVVLSKPFFSKQWPQYELDALVNKSMTGDKVILPIWHEVEHNDVSQYSHALADKVAFSTSALSIDDMANEFLKLIQKKHH